MRNRLITIILSIGLSVSFLTLVPRILGYRLPGDQQGYEPAQPIVFSHLLHSGEMQIPCLYCHSDAERSRYAGIPSASICLNCHQFVTASFGAIRAEDELARTENRDPRLIISPELRKLYEAMGYNDNIKPDPEMEQKAIEWTRIHNLPDFVYFDHRPHIGAGVECQQCHGPVETMERVRQTQSLNMGWCINCHRRSTREGVLGRKVEATIDCSACHY